MDRTNGGNGRRKTDVLIRSKRRYPHRKPKKSLSEFLNPRTLGAAVIALAVVLLVIMLIPKGGEDSISPAGDLVNSPAPAGTPTSAPTSAPTPTIDPAVEAAIAREIYEAEGAYLRPEGTEDLLPIFSKANTAQKRVAITIDDCYQVGNLTKILDLAAQYNCKLTIFPIGSTITKNADNLKRAYEMGMEIENHSMQHDSGYIYSMSDEEMAAEIVRQSNLLNRTLGYDYEMHFFRMPGGNGEYDVRTHAYLMQLGYKGIVHWSLSGTAGVTALGKNIGAGDVILYHTTDKDLEMLTVVIPALIERGYELVTLNELFGYMPNQVSELSVDSINDVVPPLTRAYNTTYQELKKGTRMYAVQLLQKRLMELGYLPRDSADGDFGSKTLTAIQQFQKNNGLREDGIATPELQTLLYSDQAIGASK